MTKCPHCGGPANPMRFLRMTHWTPYVCSACGGTSAFHPGALMLLGGIGGGVGGYFGLRALGSWGWPGIVGLIFVWVIVLTLAQWLLLELHPEKGAPNERIDPTAGTAPQNPGGSSEG